MKLSDLFQELVIAVYDQTKGHRFCDQIIWSLTIWPGQVRSNVASLTWHICDQMKWSQIRISPVQCSALHGPSPTIEPFYYYFSVNSGQLHGSSPTFRPLNLYLCLSFGPCQLIFYFRLLYFEAGPTSQMGPSSHLGPTCHVHLVIWSHTSESCIFVN